MEFQMLSLFVGKQKTSSLMCSRTCREKPKLLASWTHHELDFTSLLYTQSGKVAGWTNWSMCRVIRVLLSWTFLIYVDQPRRESKQHHFAWRRLYPWISSLILNTVNYCCCLRETWPLWMQLSSTSGTTKLVNKAFFRWVDQEIVYVTSLSFRIWFWMIRFFFWLTSMKNPEKSIIKSSYTSILLAWIYIFFLCKEDMR